MDHGSVRGSGRGLGENNTVGKSGGAIAPYPLSLSLCGPCSPKSI